MTNRLFRLNGHGSSYPPKKIPEELCVARSLTVLLMLIRISYTHLPNHSSIFLNRDTVKKEGSSWFDNEAGVWVNFSSKAVSDPRLITCSMWKSGVVSPPLEENEALVSNVIELACDEPDGINFSGVTVALSHSATDLGGYELAMKELMDSDNKTWKDLETTKLSDLSGMKLQFS